MKIVPVRENRSFLRAYKKGKKYAGKYVIAYALKTSREYPCRLGLTVTKKRGGAVVRSRVRRILRAAWCEALSTKRAEPGFDVILVARDSAVTAKSTDIAPELSRALSYLGVTL